MQLFIGNKNYSSWSLRPWLLMRELGIAFDEVALRFDSFADDSTFKRDVLAVNPAGRVPVLVDDGFAVWDTLAIAEYVAERFPDAGVWPADAKARARARSLCAEMHSGFGQLRQWFPMNIEADLHHVGHHVLHKQPGAKRDLERMTQLWTDALAASGGPFLFGAFSNADAYFAPVVSRIVTYGLLVPPELQPYLDRIQSLPAMQQWKRDALAEHDWVADDEPYREQPAA